MVKIPVYFDQPVAVRQERTELNYYIERETLALSSGAVSSFTPPIDEVWHIETMQIEFLADANVGTRELWLYTTDIRGRQQRYQAFCATAGNNYTMILGKGLDISSNNAAGIPYTTFVYTGPLYFDVLISPNTVQVSWAGFGGVGDVGSVSLLVRKYKRLIP